MFLSTYEPNDWYCAQSGRHTHARLTFVFRGYLERLKRSGVNTPEIFDQHDSGRNRDLCRAVTREVEEFVSKVFVRLVFFFIILILAQGWIDSSNFVPSKRVLEELQSMDLSL